MKTLETAFQGFFLIIVIHCRYAWGIPMGASFPVKLQAVCLPFWWKGAPLWVFLEYFISFTFYYVNGCCCCFFWAGGGGLPLVPASIFQYFKYTFYFNLPSKESFLEDPLRRLMFGKCLVFWYWISYLLSVNSALAI